MGILFLNMLFGYSLHEYQKMNMSKISRFPQTFCRLISWSCISVHWSFAVAFHLSNTYKPCGPKLQQVRRPLPPCTDDQEGMISKALHLLTQVNGYHCPELAGKQLQRWRSPFSCFKHWEFGLKQLLSLKLQILPVTLYEPAYLQKWYETG